MTTPSSWGNQFAVNTTVLGNHAQPTITGLANGRFVVSWTDLDSMTGGDTSLSAVRAQVFDADGVAAGAEFLVNTTTASSQNDPAITALADGRFVVTWTDHSMTVGDTSGTAIRAQVFNVDGSVSGAEFLVNTTTAGPQSAPVTTALANGGFVVSWTDASSTGGDASGSAIRAQGFNADGTVSGAEFLVNTTTANNQIEPAVTALADGRFVVAWTDLSTPGAGAIRAQMFNADGTRSGGEFLVNTTTLDFSFAPIITALADGRFVVAWQDVILSGDFIILANRAQVFNADGTFSGVEFPVGTTIASDPAITALADGRFVAAWTDGSGTGGDTSGYAIRAQVYNADGTVSGAEFLVNTTVAGDQTQPTLTALADGRFAVAWTDGSVIDTNNNIGTGISSQIFDPREAAVQLSGTPLDDDFRGTNFGDVMAGGLGNDTLFGAGGNDTLFGGAGNDSLNGQAGNDTLFGGAGNDRLNGGLGNDRLNGGADNDTLLGAAGNDTLFGGAGSDRLNGGADNDRLIGGAGNDTLTGGSGADVFVFVSAVEIGSGPTRDRITDFQHLADHIDLHAVQSGQVFIVAAAFSGTAGELRYENGLLTGDLNGDSVADYALQLNGAPIVAAADLIL